MFHFLRGANVDRSACTDADHLHTENTTATHTVGVSKGRREKWVYVPKDKLHVIVCTWTHNRVPQGVPDVQHLGRNDENKQQQRATTTMKRHVDEFECML